MFGCCVAGRLLQTNLTQVDESHAYFELVNASSINHVCVFLAGTGKSILLCFKARMCANSRSQYPFLMDMELQCISSGQERGSSC